LYGIEENLTPPGERNAQIRLCVLESQVLFATVSQGLDPTIGYLQACRSVRVALVYDLMEPLHPQADRSMVSFVRSHNFTPSDFVLGKDGVCRLHPQLAKRIAHLAVSNEVIQELTSWTAGKVKDDIDQVRCNRHVH
jgi:CRISPR/Cas system-associated endonuclease Cas1